MELSVNQSASSNITLSGTTSQTVVRPQAVQATVSTTNNEVVVQQPQSYVVEIASRGPQGPSFAGSIFLDTNAIGALTSGDTGKLLVWDGSKYTATDTLIDDLTIVGGAF